MPGNARPATHREGHSCTRVAATELVCPDDGTALAGRCSTLYDVPVLTVNVPEPASRRPRMHWRRPGGSGPCSALPHDAEEHIHVTGAWPTCGHRLGSGPGSDQAVAPAAVWPAGCGQLLGSGPGIDQGPVRVVNTRPCLLSNSSPSRPSRSTCRRRHCSRSCTTSPSSGMVRREDADSRAKQRCSVATSSKNAEDRPRRTGPRGWAARDSTPEPAG